MLIKNQSRRWFIIPTVVCAFAVAASAETNSPGVIFHPVRANRLIGMKVENSDGQQLGKLEDFVLEPKTGRLRYVIVSSGGFFGIGSHLKVVPPQIMDAGTAKRNTVAVNVTLEHWKDA